VFDWLWSGVRFDPEQCVDLPCKDLSFILALELHLIIVRFCQKQQKWLISRSLVAFVIHEILRILPEAAEMAYFT